MLNLDDINDPGFLKALSCKELRELSCAIRERIIDVMSKNGGHLASNLGSVELCIALHKVFNSPCDKLLFDTSHQAYTHKIVTGRNKEFSTIRNHLGLSGFTSPDESSHDHFFAGHAGTALSLALGVAKSRDLSHEPFHVIPLIGDASFTCGLTLEALNNIPEDLSRFIIVLNDNGMSISHNVGSITHIFKNSDLEKYFKHFHLHYEGPIDGHNIEALIDVFEKAKNLNKPVIIHAITEKGHGMEKASHDPVCYHGVKPFDKLSGNFLQTANAPTFPKIFGEVILELSKKHSNLITLTPAMPVGSCLVELMKTFPERCLDVGIAEGHCVTFAGGLALDRSKKVVVSIYATFLQRALDNLFQDVCLQKAPVIFALDRAGLAGGDGATHNGIYDISFLKAMPNMIIAQARNGSLLRDLVHSALDYENPFALRYPNLVTQRPEVFIERKVGHGEILKKGNSIAILAVGHLCDIAYKVDEILSKEGLDITLVDPIFIKPLDEPLLLKLLDSHSLIITLEEHALQGGFGESVNSFYLSHAAKVQIVNLGIEDVYIEHGSHQQVMKDAGLDAETIAKKIQSCFSVNTACL